MTQDLDEERSEPEQPQGEGQDSQPSQGPLTPIAPSIALAPDGDEDPDVIADAELTDTPAEPIAVFLRAAGDRLNEEPATERFDFSLEVRRR